MNNRDLNIKKIMEIYESFENKFYDYEGDEPLYEEIMKLKAAVLTLAYVLDNQFRKKPTID